MDLLAQGFSVTPESIAPWASLSVSSIVSGLLWWIITKGIPEMRKNEQAVLKSIIDQFCEEREADRESRHDTNTRFNETLAQMFEGNRTQFEKLTEVIVQLRISCERIAKSN